MNPIEYIKENPRISTQVGAGLVTIISLILAVLNINPEFAEPLATIAGIILFGATQARVEYQKDRFEELTEPDMTLPNTPEDEIRFPEDFTLE